MTNNCILHGDAWCSCQPEKEPNYEKIKADAKVIVDSIIAKIKSDQSKGGQS